MTQALAIDIGGTKILVALVEAGRVIAERRIDTRTGAGAPDWCADAVAAAQDWVPQVRAIGVAATGRIVAGRWSALNPGTLAIPDDFPLAAEISRLTGREVQCVNDAQAAAWGEYRYGAGQGRDMVFVTISTGIGGGAVLGGRLLTGARGLAASVGLTRIGLDPRAPMTEERVAGQWLARQARDLGHDIDARGVFAAAAAGEGWAEELVGSSARAVAALLANVQLLFDPARIVVGGGIGLADGYLPRVLQHLNELPPVRRPEMVPAALGHSAGVIGVADLALNSPLSAER